MNRRSFKWKPGLGNVHRNINCNKFGVNPYKVYQHCYTPFGLLVGYRTDQILFQGSTINQDFHAIWKGTI